MRLRLAVLGFLLLAPEGCLPSAFPRTGQVVDPGEFGIAIRAHGGTLAQGKATVDGTPASSAGSLPFGFDPAMAIGGWVGMVELSGRYGLFPRCEGSVNISILRPGTEFRCALADERRGNAFSIASSADLAYSTFGQGIWTRAGFDVSKRFGELAPLIDVYVSTGPERSGFKSASLPAGDTSNEYGDFGGGPYVYVVRNELRLSVPIGIAYLPGGPDAKTAFVLGIVPYAVVAAGTPKTTACVDCGDVVVHGYASNYGASLTLAYESWGRNVTIDR